MTDTIVKAQPRSSDIDRVHTQRPCPICQSSDNSNLREVDMIVPEDFCLQHQYQINQCNQCGAVFHNVDCEQDRSNYYEAYTGQGTVNYTVSKEQCFLNELTVNFLEKSCLISKTQIIADVGCSFGLTLTTLKEKGYDNIFAIDPDIAAITYLQDKGINGLVGDVETVRKELYGRFDVVILRHVLEHLYEPRIAINNVKNWLKPNGKIYIELPDLALYQHTSVFPGYFFEYEHINHFSLNALKNLMVGFLLQNSESTAEIYPCLRAVFSPSKQDQHILFSSDASFVESSFNTPNETAKKLLGKINNLKSSREIAIWGVSTFVYRLLTHTSLRDANITYLVDGNPDVQGSRILGQPILAPSVLETFSGTIVICGENSAQSIKSAISSMGLTNEVVFLMLDE